MDTATLRVTSRLLAPCGRSQRCLSVGLAPVNPLGADDAPDARPRPDHRRSAVVGPHRSGNVRRSTRTRERVDPSRGSACRPRSAHRSCRSQAWSISSGRASPTAQQRVLQQLSGRRVDIFKRFATIPHIALERFRGADSAGGYARGGDRAGGHAQMHEIKGTSLQGRGRRQRPERVRRSQRGRWPGGGRASTRVLIPRTPSGRSGRVAGLLLDRVVGLGFRLSRRSRRNHRPQLGWRVRSPADLHAWHAGRGHRSRQQPHVDRRAAFRRGVGRGHHLDSGLQQVHRQRHVHGRPADNQVGRACWPIRPTPSRGWSACTSAARHHAIAVANLSLGGGRFTRRGSCN